MTTTTATIEKQGSGLSSSTRWIIFAVIVAIIAFVIYLLFPSESQAVYANTLRQSTPLILGALCGLIGERSGVINIGIEGQMLMARLYRISGQCLSRSIVTDSTLAVHTFFGGYRWCINWRADRSFPGLDVRFTENGPNYWRHGN